MGKTHTIIEDRKKHRQILNWLPRSRAKWFREIPRQRRKRGTVAPAVACKARRSDGLEAIVRVLKFCLYHTDIPSDRIGKWVKNEHGRRERFVGLSATSRRRPGQQRKQGDIERGTGLRPGTVENACNAITAMGLWTVHQPVEEKFSADGSSRFVGLAAVRKWTPRVWILLSIAGERGEHALEQAAVSEIRRAERQAEKLEDERPTREAGELLERVGLATDRRRRPRANPEDRRRRDAENAERSQAWAQMAATVQAEFTARGWALDWPKIRGEIARRLGIRGTGPPFGT